METKPRHILVVDNDPFFLKLFAQFLERDGHTATCLDDVFHCLDVLTEITPDVIFLDLVMPYIGGDALCRTIRNYDHLQDTYIVVVSAIALERPIDFYAFGADACIAKGPFKEMLVHIREVIRESQNPRNEYPLQQLRGGEHLYSRQITRELLQQVEHLRVILKNMSQGIIEIAAKRVISINESAEEMLNITADEILGARVGDCLPRALLGILQADSIVTAPTGTLLPKTEVQFNERRLIVEQLVLRRDNPGQIFILSDITEQKRMESMIEAANLTENLGYVFSGIRHEIGNPVNSIKMALSVLKRNLHEYDKETIAEFLDRSLVEMSRIEYLLKALKNYSLFETPVVQEIFIAEFLHDFVALIRNDFSQLNISIQTMIEDKDLILFADPRALHHVMLNLLTNGADALDTIERPHIVISCFLKGDLVVLKVDDNGKGISEEDCRHLFKPFFTSKRSGTGLGLAIVRKMLTAMNGSISIESYQGVGTTATVLLPGLRHEKQTQNTPYN